MFTTQIGLLYVWLNDSGLPYEVTIRLHELATYTRKVGNRVFAIGKIILLKIIEFVQAHPHLVIGAGIGVALGAAVNFLLNSIPFIEQLLAPLATVLATTLEIVVFGVAEHRMEKRFQGKKVPVGIMVFAEEITEIVAVFFKLLADVFNTVWQNT